MTDERHPRGARISRRGLIMGGAMLATAGVAWARQPIANEPLLGDATLEDIVPRRIGDWAYQTASGLVLPPPDQMRDEIYSDLLTRVYYRPSGEGVMLLVAYSGSQDGMIQVHRPEVCYPASGYRLIDNSERDVTLAGHDVRSRFMLAQGPTRNEQLMYWTRVGSQFPTSWLGQRVVVVEENLRRRIPDGVLVRISTNAPDTDDGYRLIESFAEELVRAVPPRGRAVMLGRA